MNGQKCGNCRFYYSTAYDAMCRRYPPVPLEVTEEYSVPPNYRNDTRLVINSYYPEVDDSSWCGEWKTEETDEQERETL